ncbi:transcriptional repressor [Patescibacteria group bacterium]|nr:transcriptional repressor [Patescibacteria group bacterium]MBU1612906.1 transcriptional repressor [Patescibacteria group bacterium]
MKKTVAKLTQAGYKMTKARLAILNFLSTHHSPISARNLHKKNKTFDRASVYRTLNLFEDLHIVNVEVIEKEKLYCFAEKPHHHIICTKCGYTESVKCSHNLGNFKNFKDVYHQLTLTGTCKKCTFNK